jgi:hypothetical protein
MMWWSDVDEHLIHFADLFQHQWVLIMVYFCEHRDMT